ncbi:hypothetical protein MRX96_012322 [Rhipicephalus microplus]
MSRFWYPSYAQLPFRLCPRSEIGRNRPLEIPPPAAAPTNGPHKPRSPASATVGHSTLCTAAFDFHFFLFLHSRHAYSQLCCTQLC